MANLNTSARTRTVASILGPFLLVLGASLVLRAQTIIPTVTAFIQDDALLLLTGVVTLATGLILVGLHNYWNSPAAIVISLFGWLTSVRGAAILLVPHTVTEIWSSAVTPQLGQIAGAVFALIGLWLAYVGYFSKDKA